MLVIPFDAALRREDARSAGSGVVGRDDDLARLLDAATHPPSIAVVRGPAGIGTSSLVTALADRSERIGRRVLRGRCRPLREPFSFGVLADALSGMHWSRIAPPDSETAALRWVAPEHGHRQPPSEEATATRHAVCGAVANLMRRLGPTVLILEDLQWVDGASADLVRCLADDMPPALALVLTTRTDLTLARAGHGIRRLRVDLRPLDRQGVGTLASAALDVGGIPGRLIELLHVRTGGFPAAVVALLRLALDEGAIHSDGRVPSWLALEALGVPDVIRDSVLAELDGLGPRARRVVGAAAVLDAPASEGLLARVAGMSSEHVVRPLSDALRAGLLVEATRDDYVVRHPLAAQAICEEMQRPERRRLHRRAAAELDGNHPRPLARLARHHREAGGPRLWTACAETAADAARARADPHTAVRLLHDALSAPGLAPRVRLRLVAKLGVAALDCGGLGQPEALRELGAAIEDPGTPAPARAHLLTIQGNLLGWTDHPRAGSDRLRARLPLTRRPTAETVRVMADLGSGPDPTRSAAERRTWAERAAAASAAVSDPGARADALRSRAHVLLHVGDRSAWREMEHLVDAGDGGRVVLSQLRLATACVLLGRYARAQSFLDAIRDRREPVLERCALVHRSVELVLRFVRGDWAGLESAATALSADAADVVGASVPAAQVAGLLLLARGAHDEAETVLRPCAGRATSAGLLRSTAVATAGLARIHLARGRADLAWTEARGALAAITAPGSWTAAAELVPTAVRSALSCGLVAEADELVRAFARDIRRRDSPIGRASLALARGFVADAAGDPRRCGRRLARAARLLEELPQPYEAARTMVHLGCGLLRSEEECGAALVTDGVARLTALGAAGDADEGRLALRRHGIRVCAGGSRGRRSYGAELSPRERQVAALARRALTNDEIAHALHLSPRTVEGHMAAILRKTAVAGKRALIGVGAAPSSDRRPVRDRGTSSGG